MVTEEAFRRQEEQRLKLEKAKEDCKNPKPLSPEAQSTLESVDLSEKLNEANMLIDDLHTQSIRQRDLLIAVVERLIKERAELISYNEKLAGLQKKLLDVTETFLK